MPGEISILLDELHECQSKLTAARDETERVRARVAELEDSATDLVGAFDQTLTDTLNFEDYETLKRVVEPFRDIAASPESLSWLLRKQAEAVEESVRLYTHKMTDEFQQVQVRIIRDGTGFIYPEGLIEHAQRLRQQADEAENTTKRKSNAN